MLIIVPWENPEQQREEITHHPPPPTAASVHIRGHSVPVGLPFCTFLNPAEIMLHMQAHILPLKIMLFVLHN